MHKLGIWLRGGMPEVLVSNVCVCVSVFVNISPVQECQYNMGIRYYMILYIDIDTDMFYKRRQFLIHIPLLGL